MSRQWACWSVCPSPECLWFAGDQIRFKNSGMAYEAIEVGTLTPGAERPAEALRAGEVGYMHGGIKSVTDARVGDTIVLNKNHAEVSALGGYMEPMPVVYCGLFPVNYRPLLGSLFFSESVGPAQGMESGSAHILLVGGDDSIPTAAR